MTAFEGKAVVQGWCFERPGRAQSGHSDFRALYFRAGRNIGKRGGEEPTRTSASC